MRCQHCLHSGGFVSVISHCVHIADWLPVNDHLSTHIAVGLEQNGVHVGMWADPCSVCLHRLSAADLAAALGYRRIQRHILRFEWCDHHALAYQPTAQRADQRTFTRIRGGALHHQTAHANSFRLSSKLCSNRCHSPSERGKPKRNPAISLNRRTNTPRWARAT